MSDVKERPILFSGPMARAILDGRKTQTRRVVKCPRIKTTEGDMLWDLSRAWNDNGYLHVPCAHPGDGWAKELEDDTAERVYPRWTKGDRLWVRETWRAYERPDDCLDGVLFAADGVFKVIENTHAAADAWCDAYNNGKHGDKWRPSIFMPRWASRITLEITGVRVERLQEITDSDIAREGLDKELVDSLINPCAAHFQMWPEHWIHGSDESRSFCPDCAERECRRLKSLAKSNADADKLCVDGGWGVEGDHRPYCEGRFDRAGRFDPKQQECGRPLENTYTTFACESECEHFAEHPIDFRDSSDCEAWQRVLGSMGWERWSGWPEGMHENYNETYEAIRRISFQGTWDTINGKSHPWESNPWVWVIEFRRVAP